MTRLKVIQPGSHSRWKPVALQLYRLAVLAVIVLVIHHHHARLRIDGDDPIQLSEVKEFFPDAAALEVDLSPRQGLFVAAADGTRLGYVIRTMPGARDIVGYSGPSDTLIAFGPDMRVIGTEIRSSYDTTEHVQDVQDNRQFDKLWKRYTWDDLAKMDVEAEGIEGVSGATLTSMAVSEGIAHRVKLSADAAATVPVRWRWTDLGIAAAIALALLMTFTHLRGRKWLRRGVQVAVIGYIGFYTGALMAQSLWAGWAMSGVAWRIAPGLALLTAAALIMPWTTRRQTYCSHLCPHGALQEMIGRATPWKLRLRQDVARALRWLPAGLLALVIIVVMLDLPLNLAGIEPFDAYLVTAAGVATIVVAIIGLVAAAFVPQAYCKYGCPTGMLLEFLRSHGRADRFGLRDITAGLMVALTLLLYWQHDLVWSWIAPAALEGGAIPGHAL